MSDIGWIPSGTERILPLLVGETADQIAGPAQILEGDAADQLGPPTAISELDEPVGDLANPSDRKSVV